MKTIEQKPAEWLQELEDKLANATPKQLAEWKEKYFKEEPAEWSEEDEEIRKSLLEYLHTLPNHYTHSGVCALEWIAWLEKQGETFTKKDVDDAYLKGICDAKHELEKQGEQKPADNKGMNIDEEFINTLGTMLNDGLPDRYLVSEERIKMSAELLFSIARKQLKNEMQEWSEKDEHLSVVRTKELIRAEIQKQKQNLIDSIGRTSNKELNLAHHILCVLESFINTIPEKSIEWTEDNEKMIYEAF